tara:strand:+ start:184 stop:375 length:192 start_codon:yes stop_codon:yes gene_type:complete
MAEKPVQFEPIRFNYVMAGIEIPDLEGVEIEVSAETKIALDKGIYQQEHFEKDVAADSTIGDD